MLNVDMDTLAKRLRHAREDRDLTQTGLAKLAGVSQGTIGNIEAGIRGGLQSLAPIAMALQINYLWLRDGNGEMNSSTPTDGLPLSRELLDHLATVAPDERRRIENTIRAALDLDPLPRTSSDSRLGESTTATGTLGP